MRQSAKSMLGSRNSKCKGPEVGKSLTCLESSKEASGAGSSELEERRNELREVMGAGSSRVWYAMVKVWILF